MEKETLRLENIHVFSEVTPRRLIVTDIATYCWSFFYRVSQNKKNGYSRISLDTAKKPQYRR